MIGFIGETEIGKFCVITFSLCVHLCVCWIHFVSLWLSPACLIQCTVEISGKHFCVSVYFLAWRGVKPRGDLDICFKNLLTQVASFLMTVSKLDLTKHKLSYSARRFLPISKQCLLSSERVQGRGLHNLLSFYNNWKMLLSVSNLT